MSIIFLRRVASVLFLVGCLSTIVLAQSPVGDWNGVLTVPPGLTRNLGVHIDQTSEGVFTGTIASPDVSALTAPLADITFNDDILNFKVPAARSSFEGKWDAEKKSWSGEYTQAPGKYPLTLTLGALPPLRPLPAVVGLDGRWEGKLQGILPVVVRLTTDIDGTVAMMDSPSQRSVNVPIRTFTRDGAHVNFTLPGLTIAYAGELASDGEKITGTFTQLGQQMPFELKRVSLDATPTIIKPRPQTPQKPYPYKEEEVAFDNPVAPGLRLSCTLTTPESTGRHPAAILLSGSGAQNRDEEILNHRPFLVMADHLTKKGIAVLRCDDRHFGKSVTLENSPLVSDFVTDAKAALVFLRARADIDAKRIGFIGHSEGGVTGPRVAADDPKVAFVVMMAGLGAKGRDVLLEQRALLLKSMGATPEQISNARERFGLMFDQMLAATDTIGAKTAAAKAIAAMPTQDGKPLTQAMIDSAAAQFGSAYYVDLLRYDPAPVFARIKAPILAINGSKDIQVEPKQNLGGLKQITAKNKDVTLVELPGLNHLFQTAPTGAVSEYVDIDETIAPIALETIADWIKKRTKL